jgi:ABC-type sugar transport system ATPase subunit
MLLDRLPGQLSNGQKQRVSLGRALVRNPDVLLLDEPLSHLDAKLRHAMRTEFKALESSIQTTTLYVTHDYLEALSLGDRIAVINEGRLLQVSSPDEIFGQPANIFISTILGEPRINLITCDVVHEANQTTLVATDKQLRLIVPAALRTIITKQHLKQVVAGLRPIHLNVVTEERTPNGAMHNRMTGQVYVYERLGTRGVLTLTVGTHKLNIVTPIEMNFAIDDHVTVQADLDKLLLFNPESEKNIAID